MKLTNYQKFEKWCDRHGLVADGVLDEAERWSKECDGGYGDSDFDYEIGCGKKDKSGRPLEAHFILVKSAIYEVMNDETWATRECTLMDMTEWEVVYRMVEEPVYRFAE